MIRRSALRSVNSVGIFRPQFPSTSTSLEKKKFSTAAAPQAAPQTTAAPQAAPQTTTATTPVTPQPGFPSVAASKSLANPFDRKAQNALAADVFGELEKAKLVKYLLSIAPGYIKNVDFYPYALHIEVDSKNLVPLMAILKYHSLFQMKCLLDIQAYDTPGKYYRFTVQYTLLSLQYNYRINVRVQTREGSPLPTVTDLWNGASWSEREVWDMYGIYFEGHPNFRRILTDYGFKGHPLRKDFPLTGFVELFYDDWNHGVFYEPVELAQEYRNFNFKSPWLEK
jgi:NADH/F420H2 dehydrogenase subunit C